MYGATSGDESQGDAGLIHVGARYYDAQVGRFTSRDTELDQHPYLYCEHDPVNGIDPSGPIDWHAVAMDSWEVFVDGGPRTSPLQRGVVLSARTACSGYFWGHLRGMSSSRTMEVRRLTSPTLPHTEDDPARTKSILSGSSSWRPVQEMNL